jgi:hypothetical protein
MTNKQIIEEMAVIIREGKEFHSIDTTHNLIRRLNELGYQITKIEPARI